MRNLALAVGGALILGLGLYLYVEVHASPPVAATTTAPVKPAAGPPVPVAEPAVHDDAPPPVPAANPDNKFRVDRPVIPNRAPPPTDPTTMVASPEINMKVDAYMVEANKAYDRGDFDDASAMAAKVLARDPSNVKMLRVMVSAACINGDNAAAQKYYAPLPEGDRSQMRTRCERYGVTFDSIKPNP